MDTYRKSIEEFIVKLQPHICNTNRVMKTDVNFYFTYNDSDYVFTYFTDSPTFYVLKKDENGKFNYSYIADWQEDINYVDGVEQRTYTYLRTRTNSLIPLETDFSELTVEEFLKTIN